MCPDCIKKDQERIRLNNEMVEQRIKDGLPLSTKEGPLGFFGTPNYMFPCEHQQDRFEFIRGELQEGYYVPDIEEFCVGFVFFIYHKESNFTEKTGLGFSDYFDTLTVGLAGCQGLSKADFFDIRKKIKEGLIKVKILDADDFKALGWEPLEDEYLVHFYFSKVENDIVYQAEYMGEGRYRISYTSGEPWESKEVVLYNGKIRNKFELSKIFNQVKWD